MNDKLSEKMRLLESDNLLLTQKLKEKKQRNSKLKKKAKTI